MTYVPIDRGSADWDVPLNAALVDQDSRITTNAANIATNATDIAGVVSNVATNTANIATNTTDIAARLVKTANLSDLTNPGTARTNLGLGGAAVLNVGTTVNTVAAGDDSRFSASVPKDTLVVNVKDHGALGTGSGDDTAAIQAAITTLGSAGGIIFFPPGTYQLNGSVPVNLPNSIALRGAGPGASSIQIGSSFTGSAAITVSQDDCSLQDLRIRGASTTVTTNPVAGGVVATGVQSFKVLNCEFQWVNGYAIKALGTASVTLHGGQIDNVKIQSCAGGVWVKSDTTNTAADFQISNLFCRFIGVTTGGSANLDGVRIEDSWDLLLQNVITWMNATTGGTGSALRVRGDCAATFIQNLDALGPQTGAANVVIEGNGTTSPQNTQIQGGVIQQGIVGLLISDASSQVRVRNMRILHNQTHNVVVNNTGSAGNVEVFIDECAISTGGDGAAGTNYDINWTGTAEGLITDTRFGSPIVTVGTAGVQSSINISGATKVRALNANFSGTGAASTNWFSGATAPHFVTRLEGSVYEFRQSANWILPTNSDRVSIRPAASGNNALAITTGGTNDNFRINGNGSQEFGAGGASARDTTWGRQGAGVIGTPDSDIKLGTGKGLQYTAAANGRTGTATLTSGAVTVSNTSVTANTRVRMFRITGGTPANYGQLYTSATSVGTNFTITSSSGTDNGSFVWELFELF